MALTPSGARRVPRFPLDADREPHHAEVRRREAPPFGLGDDRRVGPVAAAGVERAVAGDLLLDHALDDQVASEPDLELAQQPRQEEVERHAALHVEGAAAEHPGADDLGRPRIVGPGRDRFRADDVDVAVEDQ